MIIANGAVVTPLEAFRKLGTQSATANVTLIVVHLFFDYVSILKVLQINAKRFFFLNATMHFANTSCFAHSNCHFRFGCCFVVLHYPAGFIWRLEFSLFVKVQWVLVGH